MVVYVVSVVALLVGIFLTRSMYRFLAPEHIDGDAYDFLLQIEDIREAGHRRPERPSQVVTNGVYSYPYFVLWVLSFLPEGSLRPVERYFSGLADLFVAGTILALVPLDFLTVPEAVLGLVLFLFTPQFMRPNLSHGNGLSPRKPGWLFTTGSLLSVVVWTIDGSPLAFALAIVFAAMMMMTSKFSLQAWTFVLVGLAIVVDPIAALVIPSALVVALVGSFGRYYRILTGHILHVYDYAVEKQYKRFDHSFPNPFRWVYAMFTCDTMDERLQLVYETRWIRAVVDTPFVPVVVGVYALAVTSGTDLAVPIGVHVWILTLLVCFVLISMPHLLFLGQAERYLEYALVPSILVIARAWEAFPVLVPGLVAGAVVVGLATQVVYVWGYRNVFIEPERDEWTRELIEELGRYDPGVVLVQPAYLGRQIAYETPHKAVERVGGSGQSTSAASRETNQLFPETYDFVTTDINWLENTYDPNWVVFDIEKLRERSETGNVSDAPGLSPPDQEPHWSNGAFEVYRFDDLRS